MPSRPLSDEQKADAARLRALFNEWKAIPPESLLGRSYEEIAATIGMKQSAFSQRLNGTMALNADAAIKFSSLIGCAIHEISPTIAKKINDQAAAARASTKQEAQRIEKLIKDGWIGRLTNDQKQLRQLVLNHLGEIPDDIARSMITVILATLKPSSTDLKKVHT